MEVSGRASGSGCFARGKTVTDTIRDRLHGETPGGGPAELEKLLGSKKTSTGERFI